MADDKREILTIAEYLSIVAEHFKEYLRTQPALCDDESNLFSVNYSRDEDSKKFPQYSEEHIQEFYILRYAYGYTFEYKKMYETLFAKHPPEGEFEVLSLGCGAKPDYLGLMLALKELGRAISVRYTGIDAIDWSYSVDEYVDLARRGDTVDTKRGDAVEVLSQLGRERALSTDALFFPRSISELDIDRLCAALGQLRFAKNRLHIMTSLRIATRGDKPKVESRRSQRLLPDPEDLAALRRLAGALEGLGFGLTSTLSYAPLGTQRIEELEPGYGHYPYTGSGPDELIMERLHEWCGCHRRGTCLKGKGESGGKCPYNSLYPLFKTSRVCNRIMTFERK